MSTDTQNRTADALEQSVHELTNLGRMWIAHGLSMGSQALAASAKSLEVTSRFLGELREQVKTDDDQPTNG